MPQNLSKENLIRDYLLGQLSDNEQDALEEKLLTDPEFFEASLIIESELLEEYVMGRLSQSDRMKVEDGLLTGEQQQCKLQLIRLLRLKSNAPMPLTNPLSRLKRFFGLHKSYLALATSGPVT